MRYLPLTPDDREAMLAAIGVKSIDDLFVDVPGAARLDGPVDLPRVAGELEVERALGDAPTTQAQFDALVSFHYNTGAIRRATLTKRHRAGDFVAAEREFGRWIYNDRRPLKGLVDRRRDEVSLYRKC